MAAPSIIVTEQITPMEETTNNNNCHNNKVSTIKLNQEQIWVVKEHLKAKVNLPDQLNFKVPNKKIQIVFQ